MPLFVLTTFFFGGVLLWTPSSNLRGFALDGFALDIRLSLRWADLGIGPVQPADTISLTSAFATIPQTDWR